MKIPFTILSLLLTAPLHAEITLPSLFSDNMVLQASAPAPVWGRAEPGETVTLSYSTQKKTAVTDPTGRWRLRLDPMPCGVSGDMTIHGSSTITLSNVVVGEVWICSGQSNMEFPLLKSANGKAEVAEADHPQIRLFKVKRTAAETPAEDVSGAWNICSPDTAGSFSAVAYYFGRHLQNHRWTPVGLIQASWGGTLAESWTPHQALASDPKLAYSLRRLTENGSVEGYMDPGNRGFDKGWAGAEIDPSDWHVIDLPGTWMARGYFIYGPMWFRKEVSLPGAWADRPLNLDLGTINGVGIIYFNGHALEEDHEVPADLVRSGRNVIAVRVFNGAGEIAISGNRGSMQLYPEGEDPMSLSGAWLCRIECKESPSLHKTRSRKPESMPASLFNGMVAPLIPYAFRGVIWYQGEADVWRAWHYRHVFSALITGWRKQWRQGEFPFLFVQLPNYRERAAHPGPSLWAELREAQSTALSLSNTGMAVAIDLGEAGDIHPKNKHDVGYRLFLNARALVYGDEIERSGPRYKGFAVEGSRIRIFFDHADGGLETRGGCDPKGFAVAGEGDRFVWAQAEIEGGSVVVWSEEIEEPSAVRYGWSANPECNLINAAGLPAAPFRTDRRPAISDFW